MYQNRQMYSLISSFPQHLKEGIMLAENIYLSPPAENIAHVVICGMGGSGIGGTIVSDIVRSDAALPVAVCKSYSLPEFINKTSLVIISSYSGNTEETIAGFHAARRNNARMVCISSGGEIEELAKKFSIDHIKIPAGLPPRAALSYSMVMLLYILYHYKFISFFVKQLNAAVNLLNQEQENIRKAARSVSETIANTIPVIYSDSQYEGVAIRLRQQLAENSKMLSWHHVFPEMNHNELVGWTQKNDSLSVLLLRSDDEEEQNKKRFEICKKIFNRCVSKVVEVNAKGKNILERTLYMLHFGDWISYHVADIKGVDAMEVNVIEYLKNELKK